MKYIEDFAYKRIFDFNYIVKLTGNKDLASNIVQSYLAKGYIKRIKRNLYAAVSFETKGIIPTKFEIASKITKNSFISYHSAFEFYGYTSQVYNEVIVSSPTQFHDFTFEHNTYRSKRVKDTLFVDKINNVKASSLAKTIVDSIDNVKTYDDFEELISALNMIPLLNGKEIIKYLKHVNKTILYSKVGLILSFYEDGYNITEALLEEMKKRGSQIARNFTSEKHRLSIYYPEWKLHAYDIAKIKEGVF